MQFYRSVLLQYILLLVPEGERYINHLVLYTYTMRNTVFQFTLQGKTLTLRYIYLPYDTAAFLYEFGQLSYTFIPNILFAPLLTGRTDDNATEGFCCTFRIYCSTTKINLRKTTHCTTRFLKCTWDGRTVGLLYIYVVYGATVSQCMFANVVFRFELYGQTPSLYVERKNNNSTIYFFFKRFGCFTVPLGLRTVVYDQNA